jgi:hypothetical protein
MCELTARHGQGMGAAWARHAICESAFNQLRYQQRAPLGLSKLIYLYLNGRLNTR